MPREMSPESSDLAGRIAPYRAGYLPADRRRIESRLASGDLLAVAATNALELGIDVGQLAATPLVGFPGTIASMWQQAGRAGRGTRDSLTVLLAYTNPLDQYFMRHPEALFQRPPEHVLVHPSNPHLLCAHLLCAAYEAPLTEHDQVLFGLGMEAVRDQLVSQSLLETRDSRWVYPWEGRPHDRVSLRRADGSPFVLLDSSHNGRGLEELDATSAFFRVHPGAIHLHQGRLHLISEMDIVHCPVWALPTDATYYTEPIEDNQAQVIRSERSRTDLTAPVFLGRVRVTAQVTGYRRHEQFTGTVQGEESLELPLQSYETQALWFGLPGSLPREIASQGLDLAGGIHAVEHAIIAMLPLYAMCDRNDIGGVSTLVHPDTRAPQVFVYDAHAGGVEIAEKGFEILRDLWESTLRLVTECPCTEGCPSCIQSPKCANNNDPLDKAASIWILRRLLSDQGS